MKNPSQWHSDIERQIDRQAAHITGHRRGCPCKRCATERVRLKHAARRRGLLMGYAPQENAARVKGRKVKGGRSVTLHNMASVTIIKRQNGTVSIRGIRK